MSGCWPTSETGADLVSLLKNSWVSIERTTQLTFTCSKSTVETLEKGVEYVQSK